MATGVSNVSSIAAFETNAVAVTRDGFLRIFGNSPFNAPAYDGVLSNFVSVSIGYLYFYGIRLDGSVVDLGAILNSGADGRLPWSNVAAVSAGWFLRRDGTVAGTVPIDATRAAFAHAITNARGIAYSGSFTYCPLGDGTMAGVGTPGRITNMNFIALKGDGYIGVSLVANQSPSVTGQTVTNQANADILLTLSGSDPENDPFAYRIAGMPGKGKLYQFNGSGRGAEIMSVPTLVTP